MKLLFSIFLFFNVVASVYAGVIPGTIQKGSKALGITCNQVATTYSPTSATCNRGTCKTAATCTSMSCPGSTTTPAELDGSGAIVIPAINNPATCVCGCTTYNWYTTTSGSATYYDYINNSANVYWQSAGNSVKLGVDLNESCYHESQGTNHTPPTKSNTLSCSDGGTSYYGAGTNGICHTNKSIDNLISSYNQLGQVSRVTSQDSDGSCTIEGRFATGDNTPPNITVTGGDEVFDTTENYWCNYDKYIADDYGSPANPLLPGCEYFKNKLAHVSTGNNPDLLEGLSLNIEDSASGIGSIRLELGRCDYTFNDFPTGLNQIIKSSNSASGVKDYLKRVSFSYKDQNIISGDISHTIPSLLTAFSVARLDECLVEGKNYLKVTAQDLARGDIDGISPVPNIRIYPTTLPTDTSNGSAKFINIDNAIPRLKIQSGKPYSIQTSGSNPFNSQCLVPGSLQADTKFKNISILGEIKSADIFGKLTNDQTCGKCTTLLSQTGSCTTDTNNFPKPINGIWFAPAGVDQNTGIFDQYSCDNVGPFPEQGECNWSCPIGKTKDINGVCVVQSSCCQIGGSTIGSCNICLSGNTSGPVTYSWTSGVWGSCNATCGGGSKSRTVACQGSDNKLYNDSYCSNAGVKPALTQLCNIQACGNSNICKFGTAEFGVCEIQ